MRPEASVKGKCFLRCWAPGPKQGRVLALVSETAVEAECSAMPRPAWCPGKETA